MRRNKDLYHKLRSLTEFDTVSSNETDTIMRSLTDDGKISRYFRLIADPFTPISSTKDWRKHEKGGGGFSVDPILDQHLQSCAANLVTLKELREKTSQWAVYAGPLSYSREQLSAEVRLLARNVLFGSIFCLILTQNLPILAQSMTQYSTLTL